MRRAPSTFALVLGLVAATLLLALGLSAGLSRRAGRDMVADAYGRLAAATVTATEALAARGDAAAAPLAALRRVGVELTGGPPPRSRGRVAPVAAAIAATTGRLLGEPGQVRAVQAGEAQLWVPSAARPGQWIVIRAGRYRERLLDSTLKISVLAGLIALLAAGLGARLLTRPLERLARGAPALLAGEAVPAALAGSPREVHRLAAAIGAAGARQRAAARERELMLAGISHDLRTPLARLRLALELGDAAEPERRAAMVADLDELDDALEQCLAFVRDGRDETPRETDLVTLAGQLLALRREPDAWQFEAPGRLPLRVRATLLRRALGNLLDNAEKHGAPPFRLSLRRTKDDVVLEVADHGPGVPAALLPRLGQPFLRADPARGGGGTGLGLSIAARAAEAHGGRLHASNAPRDGLRVALVLPAAPG